MAGAGQMGGNVYQQSAGAMGAAGRGTMGAMAGPDIQRFQNPYQQQVTDRTLQGLERQRQMQTNTLGAQASQAGAFGGSRHGVAEALTNEAFARQGADTMANLNMQGFNTALGAGQQQQGLLMQGAGQLGQLAGQGFDMGQQIANQQAQQGALQQGIQQMLFDRARGQFEGFANAPQQSLQLPLAAVGAANMGQGTQTQTQTMQPGLFNYLQLAASMVPG